MKTINIIVGDRGHPESVNRGWPLNTGFTVSHSHSLYCLLNAGVNSTTSVEELKEIGDNLVEKVQTGELSQQADLEVISLSMSDPIPEPVDPTGGVRATNETGKERFCCSCHS